MVLCRELRNALQTWYNDIVPAVLTMLYEVFDLEEVVCGLWYNDIVPAVLTMLYEVFDLEEVVCGLWSFKFIPGEVVH